MKIHLAWIRMTAAAAIAAGVGVQPAAAQYAPYHPAPAQPAAPQAAAPATPYVAYRPQPAYGVVPPGRYQAPAAYPAPVTPVAPASAYRPAPAAAYPQTAMAQYPAAYGGTPYVAQSQPTEAIPAPQQPAAPTAQAPEAMPAGAMPATAMPAEGMAPAAAPATSGYPAAGCNCGANGGYSAGQYYGAGGCGCAANAYPDVSGCFDSGCNDNVWFGGVYFLYMTRTEPSPVDLTVEVPVGSAYPYYPPKTQTVLSTQNVDADFQPGMEVRLGCTFTIGDECSSGCGCGSGYGYTGCGCNSCAQSCAQSYGWEVAWWGLDDDSNVYVRQDNINTRIYGMKNFSGLEYDRDGAGAGYAYMPVNSFYDYQMPVQAAGVNDTLVLAQRVRTNFNTQNLEINVMRFPMIDTCGSSCGCGSDACGCGTNYTGCGCQQSCCSSFSSYGSCGVRYFRIDDDFSYDTEFNEFVGGAYDHPNYDGFTYDNSNELFYDVSVDNSLIGPQVGWTSNYCCNCRWNIFFNSTFGIFDNHMSQYQRMFSGGGGVVRFAGSGDTFSVRTNKDAVAFLGELRSGVSYDFTCHCRGVLAYRAVALSGVATSVGQIPGNFANIDDVRDINSDNSLIVHGLQTGCEFRY